jgi:Ca2+-binding RTX toxin-like protein
MLVTDPDTPAADLVIEVSSSNPRLLRPRDLVLTGVGEHRTLSLTARGGSGVAEVTVSVSDDHAASEVTLGVQLGTARTDILEGSDGPDLLLGRLGDDVLIGDGGNDMLCGDAGGDVLIGGTGADLFGGGQGNDLSVDLTPADGDRTDGLVP